MSMLCPEGLARARAGAVVYTGDATHALLADFAQGLQRRGWRVGGLVQRTSRDGDGHKTGMELVAVDTGEAVSIFQALGRGAACVVDASAVTESTAALRRAVAQRVDLVVVNKFSHLEREGGGLADDTMAALAEGLPVLVAVPPDCLDDWLAFCGGQCDVLAPRVEALWRWWGAHRLYGDLVRGVAEVAVRRVVVGLNWTLVEGPDGVGLAQTPPRGGCGSYRDAGAHAGRSLRDLAGQVLSWDPFAAAVGAAAINAHYNRFDLEGEAGNGLDLFVPGDVVGRLVVVGAFPGIAERLPGAVVVDRQPTAGQYPEIAAEWLLPGCGAAVVTASAVANRSLPRLLDLAAGAPLALVGPSAPLTPRLFAYGVRCLGGLVVTDADAAARAVAEGAGARGVKACGRALTLRAAAMEGGRDGR